jgi:CRISPR type I-E-associated protein CasA/Cse1
VPLITEIRQKAEGPDYESTGWRHPLTPYVQRKQQGVMARFPKLGATLTLGNAWRERWNLFGTVASQTDQGPIAATLVQHWQLSRRLELEDPLIRVRAFGLRCDNAKVESVVDLPFTFRALAVDSPDSIRRFEEHLGEIVGVAEEMARALRGTLAEAAFGPKGGPDAPRDWGREHQVTFWHRTEGLFQRYVEALAHDVEQADDVGEVLATEASFDRRGRLQDDLRRAALDLFDEINDPREVPVEGAKTIASARLKLQRMTRKSAQKGRPPKPSETKAA